MRPGYDLLVFVLGGFAAAAAMCAAPAAPDTALATGTWGGDHAVVEVTADGARVEFDCAHGTIGAPLVVDAHGNFDVRGTLVPEAGGPTREDDPDRTRPARYTGHAEGSTLTLKVTLVDGGTSVGEFTVTRGARGRLFKCQ